MEVIGPHFALAADEDYNSTNGNEDEGEGEDEDEHEDDGDMAMDVTTTCPVWWSSRREGSRGGLWHLMAGPWRGVG